MIHSDRIPSDLLLHQRHSSACADPSNSTTYQIVEFDDVVLINFSYIQNSSVGGGGAILLFL